MAAKTTIMPENVHRRISGMLWMLGLQFVFGMGLNFIGKNAAGLLGVLGIFLIVLHVLVAFGLLVSSALLAFHYKDSLARAGAWVILATVLSGLLTVIYDNNFWSLLMALGFLASAVIYARLYQRTVKWRHPAHLA